MGSRFVHQAKTFRIMCASSCDIAADLSVGMLSDQECLPWLFSLQILFTLPRDHVGWSTWIRDDSRSIYISTHLTHVIFLSSCYVLYLVLTIRMRSSNIDLSIQASLLIAYRTWTVTFKEILQRRTVGEGDVDGEPILLRKPLIGVWHSQEKSLERYFIMSRDVI